MPDSQYGKLFLRNCHALPKCQNKILQKKEKAFRAVEEKLEDYVIGYLNKNGIKNDIEKLNEVINVMPTGIVRFNLFDRKFALMEKVAYQQGVSEKDAEMQEPCGSHATGMGGMQ